VRRVLEHDLIADDSGCLSAPCSRGRTRSSINDPAHLARRLRPSLDHVRLSAGGVWSVCDSFISRTEAEPPWVCRQAYARYACPESAADHTKAYEPPEMEASRAFTVPTNASIAIFVDNKGVIKGVALEVVQAPVGKGHFAVGVADEPARPRLRAERSR
jgi:hypothetical protein